MSQPSIHHTFDASIVDVSSQPVDNQLDDHYSETTTVMDSFSSRGSNNQVPPDQAATPMQPKTQESTLKKERQTHFLPNTELYNLWASVYDSDGNVLQSLDTHHLTTTYLPRFLETLASRCPYIPPNPDAATATPPPPLRITDLGTGTGRCLSLLLSALRSPSNKPVVTRLLGHALDRAVHITGIDASENMLSVARSRVPALSTDAGLSIRVDFATWDVFSATPPPTTNAHGLLSTLMLEHVPLEEFFGCVRTLVCERGVVLVSNMHPEMGLNWASSAPGWLAGVSGDAVGADDGTGKENESATGKLTAVTGAGFVDAKTGAKMRAAEDYAHGVQETVEAAREVAGLEVVGDVGEGGIEEWMVKEGIVDEQRGRKWVGTGLRCWYGMIAVRDEDD